MDCSRFLSWLERIDAVIPLTDWVTFNPWITERWNHSAALRKSDQSGSAPNTEIA